MRVFLLALLLGLSLDAQNLSFYIDTTDGQGPTSLLQPLPSAYPFPDTPVGQSAAITVRVVNTSTATLTANAIYIGATPGSSTQTSNFKVTGFDVGATLPPGSWKIFFLSFTPAATGPATGYMQVAVAGKPPAAISTLSGNGLPFSVSLTCTDTLLPVCDGKTPVQTNSSLLFGGAKGLALGASYSIPFKLTNNTSGTLARPVISSTNYAIAAFTSPDLAAVPGGIAPGLTETFTVVFTPQPTPGPSGPENATLTIGSAAYTLQGLVLPNSPNITYVYSTTGKPCQGCSAYAINVGPQADTLSVLFAVTNTEKLGTQYADITLSATPTLSGAGFVMSAVTLVQGSAVSGTAVTTGQPVTIKPGYALKFQVTFSGATASTGILTIPYGSGITYTLNGQPAPAVGSSQSDLPGIVLMCGASSCASQTFASQQQVQATLQVNAATTAGASLAIAFTPLLSGAADPAVTFIYPYTQTNLNFLFTPGSLSGMLSNGQPDFKFQTGTIAGTISFTLTDSATQQTITLPAINILPSKVQITSSTALRQSPNLILTITGYDNTYSVGPLSFTFSDVSGKLLTPSAIQVDATSNFKQYFSGSTNQAGGAFSLQVSFPVQGDVTQVGSVTANLTNSAGQTSVTQTFP